MKIRTWLAVLLIPLVAAVAFAIPVTDPSALAQRIMMMTNQGAIITNQLTQIQQFSEKLTEMREQVAHLKEQALGTVGALTEPFTELASQSTPLVGSALTWKDDFTGIPGELAASVEAMSQNGTSFRESWSARLSAADTVTESDILSLYGDFRPEVGARAVEGYRAAREEGDKRLVLDHTMSDTAGILVTAAKEALASYDGLRNNTNLSGTALAQSQVTGQVTQGNLTVAMAQLMAFQAAKQAAQDYEREIARREELARQVETARKADINFAAQQAGLDARRDSMREGLLFKIPALYGGSGQ